MGNKSRSTVLTTTTMLNNHRNSFLLYERRLHFIFFSLPYNSRTMFTPLTDHSLARCFASPRCRSHPSISLGLLDCNHPPVHTIPTVIEWITPNRSMHEVWFTIDGEEQSKFDCPRSLPFLLMPLIHPFRIHILDATRFLPIHRAVTAHSLFGRTHQILQ